MPRKMTAAQVGLKHGFRSGLEERTAAHLDELGVPFEFEQHKIAYIHPERRRTYSPDFIIRYRPDGTPRKKPLIIETKGRFLVDDRTKQRLVKDQFPEIDLRFVFSNPNARISKTSKTTYAQWCDKHGFQYAKEHIPREWLQE